MSSAREEAQVQEILKELRKLNDNKTCMICTEKVRPIFDYFMKNNYVSPKYSVWKFASQGRNRQFDVEATNAAACFFRVLTP